MKICDKQIGWSGIGFAMLVASAVIFISGCATSYQSEGFTGGYKDEQLTKTEFKISFASNAYTKHSATVDFAKLRAAEVTLEHNFKYFVIMASNDRSVTEVLSMPATTTTRGQANAIGSTVYYNETTTTTQNNIPLYKPWIELRIKCYHQQFDTDALIYDAAKFKAEIKKKYGLK